MPNGYMSVTWSLNDTHGQARNDVFDSSYYEHYTHPQHPQLRVSLTFLARARTAVSSTPRRAPALCRNAGAVHYIGQRDRGRHLHAPSPGPAPPERKSHREGGVKMTTSGMQLHSIDNPQVTWPLTSLTSADAALPVTLRRAPALSGVTGAVPCRVRTKHMCRWCNRNIYLEIFIVAKLPIKYQSTCNWKTVNFSLTN